MVVAPLPVLKHPATRPAAFPHPRRGRGISLATDMPNVLTRATVAKIRARLNFHVFRTVRGGPRA